MSTTKLFKAGIIATVGVAGLTLAANAQSRYGNVYDYESGRNCGSACTPTQAAPVSSRYGAPVVAAPTYNPAPVYVAPRPSVVYTQPAPAPVYTQPAPAPVYTPAATQTFTQTTQLPPVNCPSGTTAQSDGTCMQTGSTFSSGSSFSTGSTYSEPSYSSSTSSSSFGSVSCPAGTISQPDGTCMQSGSSTFTGSSVELYTGDATTTSGGYGSSTTYSSPDYLPIRK